MTISIDAARCAVLSMDLQAGIVSAYAKDRDPFLARVNAVLQSARQCGATVVHVTVGFRPGMPEINPRNPLFSGIKASPERRRMFEGEAAAIDPAITRQDGDIVVRKSRVSAFTGTDLDMVLRARSIDTLIVCGIATSGVVLSTVLHASDADYRMLVVEDCCTDRDEALHRSLMDKIFSSRATIVSASGLITMLGRQAVQ